MAGRLRSSLWADVVLNLAVLTVVTIALNALLLGKVVQGREVELRSTLATELSQALAVRASLAVKEFGPPEPDSPRPFEEAFAAASLPEGGLWFGTLVSRDLQVVATVGDWPDELRPRTASEDELDALRREWALQAVDVRASISGKRTERGEWEPRVNFFSGRSYATASTPVLGESRQVVGAVRVLVPLGTPLFGPMDRHVLPVLGLSILLSAVGVGAFGYFLFRRRVLHPVQALVDGTKDVKEGRFDTRLPSGVARELGELASAFNDMAEALETYKRANEEQLGELRATNADLSQAREDLIFAEKMATVGRLAAGVAHEVGNPLASVIGFVELLQNDSPSELGSDLLPRIRSELDRIHRIIRDLLNYSRPTGMTHSELEPLSEETAVLVPEVVDTAVQLVNAQPRFAKVEFAVDLPEGLPAVTVPADRLQQVLLNLFVNAAEAMGGQGRIRIARVEDGLEDTVTLSVEDEGPGIDPRAGSNIYEPFFSTKDVGAGTGLGLAVSLRLVEKMGGRLRHRRDHQGGACFHLSLPALVAS